MTPLFLSEEELEQLTGRKRCREQCKALTEMGITWKVNAAGDLIVGRKHVEQALSGEMPRQPERKRPNLGVLM